MADMVRDKRIGKRLKEHRLAKGMTLKEVESSARVSATHISEIERGMTSPTIGALSKITNAIGIELAGLIKKEYFSGMSIVSRSERKPMQFKDWGATYYSMTKDISNPKISLLEVKLDPGIKRPEEKSSHEGEEFAFVIKGVMEILIGDEQYIMKEGDSIHYMANKPHAMRNIGGVTCRAIWVTLPPFIL
ncbi:MAG TPA: XRE family transcriptional regulator [Candidatus Krumholzibacteriaceae bacterium]|nr:XRE family transcriptional regulator [Candidatus Krumholzibacteriaceae bacterium]